MRWSAGKGKKRLSTGGRKKLKKGNSMIGSVRSVEVNWREDCLIKSSVLVVTSNKKERSDDKLHLNAHIILI